MINKFLSICFCMVATSVLASGIITQIDTKQHTILKIRTAQKKTKQLIIASDYDGNVLCIDYCGKLLWTTILSSGTMNNDIWCSDITGDGIDEILAANANGHLYCLDIDGKIKWDFKPYESFHLTPMYAVCTIRDTQHKSYVVCGNLTSNCYYLDCEGKLVKTIPSNSYSKVMGWGKDKPEDFKSNSNFLRPVPQKDGSDLLAVNASNNHMQGVGELDLLKPLSSILVSRVNLGEMKSNTGEMRVVDSNDDGIYEILLGSSTLNHDIFCKIEFSNDYSKSKITSYTLNRKNSGIISYRVNQPFIVKNKKDFQYFWLSSNQLNLYPSNGSTENVENIPTSYSFFDVWNGENNKIILASVQDGGSCIYIIDTNNANWKSEFKELKPQGKIKKIIFQTNLIKKELTKFKKPSWQRPALPVTCFEKPQSDIVNDLNTKNITFLSSPWNRGHCQITSWRSPLYDGNIYKDKRDRRNKYDWTSKQIYDFFTESYSSKSGISMWAGHGNDPLYYDLSVLEKIADYGYKNGKKQTIYIYPEMNHVDKDFKFVMDKQIYPLVEYLKSKNSKVAFRAKNIFWQGQVYTEVWERVRSGELSDVVIPLLEETSDKSQDLSISGRMGLWLAGSVDGWGVRCSRDDPSFDRSRQFSSQKLANHNLLKTIYSIASGATYIHNAYPDTENKEAFNDHSSLILELISKEALYVPKREELLSISPVHLSIYNPQQRYLKDGENNKWTTLYNREFEENNPAVFSHLNGSWLGAALTPWDFSSYASGVIDRRQNCIPPYPNGMILITPVQDGNLSEKNQPRGKLVDHLNPFYRDKMIEYITDGVNYISKDGKKFYRADEYYKKIQKDIQNSSKLLPVMVSGDKVGWVVAQVSSRHLRLTLVDSGYLNPKDRNIMITFNNIKPIKVTDILNKETFNISGNKTSISIPCGMFRFIDIELSRDFK